MQHTFQLRHFQVVLSSCVVCGTGNNPHMTWLTQFHVTSHHHHSSFFSCAFEASLQNQPSLLETSSRSTFLITSSSSSLHHLKSCEHSNESTWCMPCMFDRVWVMQAWENYEQYRQERCYYFASRLLSFFDLHLSFVVHSRKQHHLPTFHENSNCLIIRCAVWCDHAASLIKEIPLRYFRFVWRAEVTRLLGCKGFFLK